MTFIMINPNGSFQYTEDEEAARLHGVSLVLPEGTTKEEFEATCRLMHDNTFAIPGMPEVETNEEAMDKLLKFTEWTGYSFVDLTPQVTDMPRSIIQKTDQCLKILDDSEFRDITVIMVSLLCTTTKNVFTQADRTKVEALDFIDEFTKTCKEYINTCWGDEPS